MEDAIAFDDLPEGHLFRILDPVGKLDQIFTPPVLWDAILARLESVEGRNEVRQWVV